MHLLSDAAFADAMGSFARHGLTAAAPDVAVLPDSPEALAAEGGGDDPAACLHDADDEPIDGTGESLDDPGPRTAGSWRATWLADVLRAEGLTVVEVQGWRSRGYAYPGPPKVSLFHHTASGRNSGPAGGLRVVAYGRPGLPGPIANWLVARNGVVYVIASGISNNAGRGNARAAGMPNVTGNAATFGDEMENDGIGEPFTAVQYTAAIKAHAAVHRRMGWTASRGIGHKEWSVTGKPDPKLSMAQVRRDLATAIARGTTPTTDEDDDMNAEQFAALLRDKTVRATLGEIFKETRLGFDASPDGKGYTVGGLLLEVWQRTAQAPAKKGEPKKSAAPQAGPLAERDIAEVGDDPRL
jgi:hypothetical protein